MPVAELLQRISSAELTEWWAVWQIRHEEAKKAARDAERRAKGGGSGWR